MSSASDIKARPVEKEKTTFLYFRKNQNKALNKLKGTN